MELANPNPKQTRDARCVYNRRATLGASTTDARRAVCLTLTDARRAVRR